ncbi:MAG TPA: D-alanyl-D-alanine carboxypeptidase/D-alanyl-D-alanine-endopeptidase [Phycisphaerales bacterium]|nr:D-alanyl-D-alanine carboxypeptidase/D-alanyl-D-alanine-endopeptidase [Phycisphaerales bacterium]
MKVPHALAAAAATMMVLAGTALAQPRSLNDEVSRSLGGMRLGPTQVGISLVDLETGDELADVHADVALTPASNMKLLTTGAAVSVLGPDFTFKTEIIRDGTRLIVRGAGDPALGDPLVLQECQPKLTVGDMLGALASAVAKSGMTEVTEIIVDDRVFDRELVHPSWPVNQLDRPYCAQVSGVNFHANVLSFFPGPGIQGAGTPPVYSTEPEAPWVRVDVRARTIVDGKNSAWITREAGEDRFALRGDVRFQTQQPIDITLQDPAMFFGRLLAHQVSKAGVKVSQGASGMNVRLAQPQESLAGGRAIAAVHTPIADVLRRCNADSENMYAEALLKRVGHAVTKDSGSWNNGGSVLRMVIGQKLGPTYAASTTISDGSGMSRGNQVSPATFTKWLGEMAEDAKVCEVYTESLARPGMGTLRNRFKDGKLKNELRAKSGYIDGVRCLSGYVINPSTGRRVAFSVMVNDIKTDDQTRDALRLHEAVVKIADQWLTQKSAQPEQVKVGG